MAPESTALSGSHIIKPPALPEVMTEVRVATRIIYKMMDIMRDLLSQYILIPIGKEYSRRKYFQAKNYQYFLEKLERGSSKELIEYQNILIRRMITHAYEYVPYYKNLFDEQHILPTDINCKDDLKKIPLLTKEILVRNLDNLTATNAKKKSLRLISTGGTTGTPIRFYRDWESEYLVDGNNWRFYNYCNYRVGMKLAKLWGNESDLLNSYNFYGKLKGIMENEIVLNFYDLSEDRLRNYVNTIRERKPIFWKGFSSAVYTFMRYLRRNNLDIPRPKAVIITSDKIDDYQRKELEEYFDGSVYNEYGSREFSIMGFECEKHNGIHVGMENAVIEIIPSNEESGYGEVVVTSLINWGMPFIRYELGDSSKYIQGDCECGRYLPRLESIRGRVADFVITKNDKLIYGDFFAHLFYGSKGIEHYQVIQNEVGKVEIYIEANEYFSKDEINIFLKTLNDMTGNNLEAKIVNVARIERHRSGKRRSVISNISKEYIQNIF